MALEVLRAEWEGGAAVPPRVVPSQHIDPRAGLNDAVAKPLSAFGSPVQRLDRRDSVRRLLTIEKAIGACFHGPDGRILECESVSDRFHFHVVGKDDAPEVEALSEKVDQDPPREGCRVVGVDSVEDDMSAHEGGKPFLDRSPEGKQLEALELEETLPDVWEIEMRIEMGVAVTREVFSAGDHTRTLEPVRE